MFTALLLSGVLAAQPPALSPKAEAIRFPVPFQVQPPAPMPVPLPANAPQKLTPELWYVIDSDVPLLLLSSPTGRVITKEEPGPLRIRGRFIDGKAVETRTYTGKHVYTVEGTHAGIVELLAVPVGATAERDVIRRTLEVIDNARPMPEPDPSPQPDPKPKPAPYVGKWFMIVIEETVDSAINRGQYFGDAELKRYLTGRLTEPPTVADKNVIDGRTNKPPVDLVPYLERAKGKKLPQLYIVGEKGQMILEGDVPPTPEKLLEVLRKVGGS